MSFSGLFQTQGMLFLLLLIGYIFGKKGLADGTGKNLLTDLVIYVTLPGSIIKSFQIEFNHQILDCLYDHCYCGDRNTDRKLCSWNVSL